MKSLKKFKRLIVEGKESPLEPSSQYSPSLKIPEIRESAYKIIQNKTVPRQNQNQTHRQIKEHSMSRKENIKLSPTTLSPLKIESSPILDITARIHCIESSRSTSNNSKLTTLELTQQQLQYLEKLISIQNQMHQNRIQEGESIQKLQQKVVGLRRKHMSTQPNPLLHTLQHKHHNSEHQTEILSDPSSFEDLNKTQGYQSTSSSDWKSKYQSTCGQGNVYDQSGLQFKKIMYILQEKSRAMEEKGKSVSKFKQPATSNYRLIEEGNVVSISFRGEQRNPQKKAQLLEIVSMLNTKYKKNIQFN